MIKELEIQVGYNDDKVDGEYYILKTKGRKTRYSVDGLTLIQIISGWIKDRIRES